MLNDLGYVRIGMFFRYIKYHILFTEYYKFHFNLKEGFAPFPMLVNHRNIYILS